MSDKILCDTSDLTPMADAVRTVTGETKAYSVIELGSKATELILNGGSNAEELINEHNVATDSHGDIRRLINNKLNAENYIIIHVTDRTLNNAPTEAGEDAIYECNFKNLKSKTTIRSGDFIFCEENQTLYRIFDLETDYAKCSFFFDFNVRTPIKGEDYFTEEDKRQMVYQIKSSFAAETWTFTLTDGSTVTKKVLLG